MIDKQHLWAKLHTRAYLWRLLICLCLLCAGVALSVFCVCGADLKKQNDDFMQRTQQSASHALAASLDSFADQLELTAGQTDALSGQALASYLRGVEYALSAVTRLCVYEPDTGLLLGSAGEEPFDLFVHTFFPSLSAPQFTALLTADSPALFAESSSGTIAFPVKTKERVVLFVLSGGALKAHADAVLPSPFQLLSVTDAQGNAFFTQGRPTGSAQSFPAAGNRLLVQIAPASSLSGARYAMQNTSFLLVFLFVCAAFIALAAAFLYRPVTVTRALIPDAQREELRGLHEFAAIATSIADGERLQEEMQQEALEQRSIAISRLYEKLLYGIRIPPEKLSALPFSSAGQFQVAVARLNQALNVNAVKSSLADDKQLYVLELYDTAHLALICTAENPDAVLARIHDQLHVSLGVGSLCHHLTGLHKSYIEAVSALGTGEGVVHFSGSAAGKHPEEDPQISVLADALLMFMQSDHERALTVADEIFDLLDTREDSLLFRQHAYVRFVMPFFDRVRETYPEAQFSIEPITNATHWGSVSLKERFCGALTEAMNSLPARKPLEQDGLLFFVEEHLFDPYFGLGNIAQKYNITEYTASRLFKEVSGVSFKKYVTNRRIGRAKHLLASSDLKMSEIAQQCGFASASYFARIFRNAEDLSPAEYRQQEQLTKPQ